MFKLYHTVPQYRSVGLFVNTLIFEVDSVVKRGFCLKNSVSLLDIGSIEDNDC